MIFCYALIIDKIIVSVTYWSDIAFLNFKTTTICSAQGIWSISARIMVTSSVNFWFKLQPISNGAFRNTQLPAYRPIWQSLIFKCDDFFLIWFWDLRPAQFFALYTGVDKTSPHPLTNNISFKLCHSTYDIKHQFAGRARSVELVVVGNEINSEMTQFIECCYQIF